MMILILYSPYKEHIIGLESLSWELSFFLVCLYPLIRASGTPVPGDSNGVQALPSHGRVLLLSIVAPCNVGCHVSAEFRTR